MNAEKRPLAVIVLALLFIAVGAIGFVSHFPELHAAHAWSFDDVAVESTELLAIVGGVFMLRGHNWARWLALAWMGFHVVLSALDAFRGLAVHILLFSAFAWLLFRPEATRYFRHSRSTPS